MGLDGGGMGLDILLQGNCGTPPPPIRRARRGGGKSVSTHHDGDDAMRHEQPVGHGPSHAPVEV